MKKLRVIMIDGFKEDYLKYAPYLKSLTNRLQWGYLEMPPGHWGGVEIFFNGKSNILAVFCKSKNSSLRFMKYFQWLEKFNRFKRIFVDILINLPRFIKREELFKTGNIPLSQLYKFEISIKKHPAKRKDVDFVYFGELDNLAHKQGIESRKIKDAIRRIDKEISKIKFDIIFSDHGMVDVKERVSVPWFKDCFIDGDMARYWGKESDLKKIRENLPLDKGKIVEWSDKKFGDLIFIANTGILIYPNFWDGKNPSKAMHGYDGKHKEMKAFYIINKESGRKDLKVVELHKIFKEMKNGR
jgi:hypothetical protein